MTQERPERRARTVALIGLIFQTLITALVTLLTLWGTSPGIGALALLCGVGILVWLPLVLIYHQKVLVQEETFESEQLRKEQEAGLARGTVFEVEAEELLLARRRLRWMYRWLVPGSTILIVAALVAGAFLPYSWKLTEPLSAVQWPTIQNTSVLIGCLGGLAFLCFLLSRYTVGMARQREWQMLRAGASYLMGITLGAVALAIALGAFHWAEAAAPERVLAYVLRILMLVLAVEFGLNLMLDFYRPRAADEEPRLAFDSRLLGLFTEPGGIARSIADAINYQFGFEVSSTWFYKLIERSAVPLLGFATLCLLLASSFVFVGAEERCVVERFGKRLPEDLQPGLHLKWPWPVDIAYKVGIERVHTLRIGLQTGAKKADETQDGLILWTNEHSQEPHLLVLVATPKLAEFISGQTPAEEEPGSESAPKADGQRGGLGDAGEAVSVSQLRVSVDIEYRIREAYDWVTTYRDPEGMLEAIAKREIVRYFASADVVSVLGAQRGPIESALKQTIQEQVERAGLNVDLVFLGLQGVHPPLNAAESFQDVVGAEQKKTAAIRIADSEYNKRLSKVAGDVRRAKQLDAAIRKVNRLLADKVADPDELEATRQLRDTLFFGDQDRGVRPAGGDAISRIAAARADRWRLENEAHGQALLFEQEIATKNITPRAYRLKRYLEAVAEAVTGIRKYVIASKAPHSVQTFHLDVKDPMTAPIETVLEGE